MKLLKNGILILLSCFAFLGLAACERDGGFENTGENIDQGFENTQEGVEDAGDEIEQQF